MSSGKCLLICAMVLVTIIVPLLIIFLGYETYGFGPTAEENLDQMKVIPTGSVAQPYRVEYWGEPDDGWAGLYAGVIAPYVLAQDIFGGPEAGMYNPHNNGWPYNLGFLLGDGLIVLWLWMMGSLIQNIAD